MSNVHELNCDILVDRCFWCMIKIYVDEEMVKITLLLCIFITFMLFSSEYAIIIVKIILVMCFFIMYFSSEYAIILLRKQSESVRPPPSHVKVTFTSILFSVKMSKRELQKVATRDCTQMFTCV